MCILNMKYYTPCTTVYVWETFVRPSDEYAAGFGCLWQGWSNRCVQESTIYTVQTVDLMSHSSYPLLLLLLPSILPFPSPPVSFPLAPSPTPTPPRSLPYPLPREARPCPWCDKRIWCLPDWWHCPFIWGWSTIWGMIYGCMINSITLYHCRMVVNWSVNLLL